MPFVMPCFTCIKKDRLYVGIKHPKLDLDGGDVQMGIRVLNAAVAFPILL